ncbi:LysE family translocator [Pseudodesulfovibrio sediminis]|uniref:Threonine/homoserine/homoserine lactone efflux protein n=1 Tax=Pseudodesulfovibrio sediminis TaxID=2810563 RepID=A0ABM7P7S8_9BACT|nr:LysE family translocator [Pseudodesulfovibrio sediminis]BCS88973.1 hypothetical protein PSDVSF_22150 [Pseudodesulfovibrio sediminis]
MNMETYTAFLLFAIVMTATPGAGNLTMMGIGQNTGFKSSLPFLAGAVIGALGLNTMVSLGLGGLFMASPRLAWVMKIGGMGYICYLGWKLLSMRLTTGAAVKRFTFMEGVILHPLNPKSWAMSVVGFSQIANNSRPFIQQLIIFVLTFMACQITFHSSWGLAGVAIMRTLKSNSVLMGVNTVLVAVMIGATAYALFLSPT